MRKPDEHVKDQPPEVAHAGRLKFVILHQPVREAVAKIRAEALNEKALEVKEQVLLYQCLHFFGVEHATEIVDILDAVVIESGHQPTTPLENVAKRILDLRD